MAEYKILVPLDGSKLAEHSLAYLRQLSELGQANIRLVSVVDETNELTALTKDELLERESNILSAYLREIADDLKEHVGVKAETKVLTGPPATCILAEAESFAPDLLVISTHGRSGLPRWRLGSVADKVIRGASCNTLVIGPKAFQKEKWLEADVIQAFKSLIVPLDGSVLAEEALPVAMSLVEVFAAQIHLIRVVPIPMLADDLTSESYLPDLLDIMVSAARTYLSNQADRLNRPGNTTTDVLVGSAAVQLEDYIAANHIDLVIMTSHGRGGFIRSALGSVTDRLLGSAAPVLVVRPREL